MEITLWRPDGIQSGNTADIASALAQNDIAIWVDLNNNENPTMLSDVFKFHPLAIEDTYNQRQRPKLEDYDDYLFVILNSLERTPCKDPLAIEFEFFEINAFIADSYIVTLHRSAEPIMEEMRRRLNRPVRNVTNGAGYLMYVLLDVVVDYYIPMVERVSDALEELEGQILRRPNARLLDTMMTIRYSLNELWRVVGHTRELVTQMRQHPRYREDEMLQYALRDVYEHVIYVSDTVNLQRDWLMSMVELQMSMASSRLNVVVTRLTVFTLIIGALTVISGFYGMNFEHTSTFYPALHVDWGVPAVLLLMVGVVLVMLIVFKLLGWLE
jgi:magnesium transporter